MLTTLHIHSNSILNVHVTLHGVTYTAATKQQQENTRKKTNFERSKIALKKWSL